MIPILFKEDASVFATHGIGDLTDATNVIAEYGPADGTYEDELAFTYPINGELFSEIVTDRIVYANVGGGRKPQAYRIYSIKKSMKSTIEVSCQHISYDLSDVPVRGFKSTTAPYAISQLSKNKLISESRFSILISGNFESLPEKLQFEKNEPGSMREYLLDGDESICGKFGGDIVVDNFKLTLYQRAGENRGVTIRYGIDLVDIDQETNLSKMVTGIVGYYKPSGGDDGQIIYARDRETNKREYIPESCANLAHQRIKAIDLSDYFESDADEQAIYDKSKEYAIANKIGEPEISLTLSYAQLGQDVRLYDQINVEFPKLGIEKSAKVTKVKYDVLKERIIEVEVGKVKKTTLFSLDDASRLERGLLPVDRIKAQSISSSHLSTGSGTNRVIGDGAVSYPKLGSDVETHFKTLFADKAIIAELNSIKAKVDELSFGTAQGMKVITNGIQTNYISFKGNVLRASPLGGLSQYLGW